MLRHARLLKPASFSFISDDERLQLGLWNAPYRIVQPGAAAIQPLGKTPSSPWECFEAQLGSILYDKIIEMGWARIGMWKDPELDLGKEEALLKDELGLRGAAWTLARDGVCEGSERVIRDVYLTWGARLAVMLAEEWILRTKGFEEYEHAAAEGKLPWQRMIKEMRGMLARKTS